MTGIKRPRDDKERLILKKIKTVGISLIVLILLFVFIIGVSLFLLSMDKYHDCYQNFIINHYLKRNNYYDGTAWLSVTATLIGAFISAVPGFICGILAMKQTHRLHELEARYHRPALEIEKVELSFTHQDRVYRDGEYHLEGFDREQRYGVIEAKKQPFAWYMNLRADLSLNNEVGVQHIDITSVTFSFPNADTKKEYKLSLSKLSPNSNSATIRSFKRTIKKDHAVYILSYCLNPFTLKPSDAEDDFNESIRNFAFYSEAHDPRFLQLDLSATMNISYDYLDRKSEECLLRIAFEANAKDILSDTDAFGTNPNIIKTQSADGYITYEVRA